MWIDSSRGGGLDKVGFPARGERDNGEGHGFGDPTGKGKPWVLSTEEWVKRSRLEGGEGECEKNLQTT